MLAALTFSLRQWLFATTTIVQKIGCNSQKVNGGENSEVESKMSIGIPASFFDVQILKTATPLTRASVLDPAPL